MNRPDPLSVPLSLILGSAGHLCHVYENTMLQEYGITGRQAAIIMFLIANGENEVNQKKIEEGFRLKAATITSMLSTLESGGFIERTVSETDARNKIIRPTKKALQVENTIKETHRRSAEIATAGFTAEEKEVFRRYLIRAVDNIHGEIEKEQTERGKKK